MTDLSGLINFRNKIQNYLNNNDLAYKIAERGADIARTEYAGSSANVYAEKSGANEARVVAEGTDVLFDEYGTGWIGEGQYQGNLPTETITFESAGETHTTQGWEYHYPNPKTKKPKNNPYFWFTPTGERSQGDMPKAQMWKTSVKLREQLPEIVRAELNKKGE